MSDKIPPNVQIDYSGPHSTTEYTLISMLKTLNVMLDVLKSLDKRMATIEEIINGPQ